MIKVVKAIFTEQNNECLEEFVLEDDEHKIYLFVPNQFIRKHNRSSIKTGKQYAYKLAQYLNFLYSFKHKHYYEAVDSDIVDFFHAFSTSSTSKEMIKKRNDNTIISINSYTKSADSIALMETVLVGFYVYASAKNIGTNREIIISISSKTVSNQGSFYYGQTWNKKVFSLMETGAIRQRNKRNHVKWYSQDEIESISSNLLTARDKSIFLLSLEGMRIDEILSLRLCDYNNMEGYVKLYRSKGRETGNVGRTMQLSSKSIAMLNSYIENERDQVVSDFIKKHRYPLPSNLFINLISNEFYGKAVKYENYLKILKRAGEKAGFDASEIRTHSGRSTRTMQLLDLHMDDPKITVDFIQHVMGWRSSTSIDSYINHQDKKIAYKLAKKLQGVQNEKK